MTHWAKVCVHSFLLEGSPCQEAPPPGTFQLLEAPPVSDSQPFPPFSEPTMGARSFHAAFCLALSLLPLSSPGRTPTWIIWDDLPIPSQLLSNLTSPSQVKVT